MRRAWRRAAALWALGAVAACAGPARRDGLRTGTAEASVLWGHGHAATVALAHAAALADLAAQVRSRVSAQSLRLAEAGAAQGRTWSRVRASQQIVVDSQLAFAELARRRRIHADGAGGVDVTLVLDRAAWAARRREEVDPEARLVARTTATLATEETSAAARWHALGRAVAAARAWRAAEREAAGVDPTGEDAASTIDRALARLVVARDAEARSLSCLVRIEGDPTLAAIAAAACGAGSTPSLLGPLASDAHRLVLHGRVERTLVQEDGLVFAESRAVLSVEGDGRTLETLELGGPATRRGHLDEARARASADAALRALAAAELEARFR